MNVSNLDLNEFLYHPPPAIVKQKMVPLVFELFVRVGGILLTNEKLIAYNFQFKRHKRVPG